MVAPGSPSVSQDAGRLRRRGQRAQLDERNARPASSATRIADLDRSRVRPDRRDGARRSPGPSTWRAGRRGGRCRRARPAWAARRSGSRGCPRSEGRKLATSAVLGGRRNAPGKSRRHPVRVDRREPDEVRARSGLGDRRDGSRAGRRIQYGDRAEVGDVRRQARRRRLGRSRTPNPGRSRRLPTVASPARRGSVAAIQVRRCVVRSSGTAAVSSTRGPSGVAVQRAPSELGRRERRDDRHADARPRTSRRPPERWPAASTRRTRTT